MEVRDEDLSKFSVRLMDIMDRYCAITSGDSYTITKYGFIIILDLGSSTWLVFWYFNNGSKLKYFGIYLGSKRWKLSVDRIWWI